MSNLITSSQGVAHITPRMDAHWHMDFFGASSFISEGSFIPTAYQNRVLRIGEGVGSLQGRFFEVPKGTYDQVTFDSASSSYKRIDILGYQIKQNVNGTQTGEWKIIKGTQHTTNPQPPSVPTGDLDAGSNTAFLPVIQVLIANNQLSSVETIAPILSGLGKYTTGSDRLIKRGSLTIAYSLSGNATGYVDQSLPTIQGYTILAGCYYANKQNIVLSNNGWETGDTSSKRLYFKNLSSSTISFEAIANLIYIKKEMVSPD